MRATLLGARNIHLPNFNLRACLQSCYIDPDNTHTLPDVDLVPVVRHYTQYQVDRSPAAATSRACTLVSSCTHCIRDMNGVDKLVCVFVGQLARKGINVKYISDLASRLDPTMAES